MVCPLHASIRPLIVAAICAVILGAPTPAASQSDASSDTLWRYSAPTKVRFTQIDAAGHFLVAMESLLVALDPASGTPAWTYRFHGKVSVFRTVLGNYFVVGHGRSATAIDPVTGSAVWQRTDLPDLDQVSFATPRDRDYALLQAKESFAVLDLRTGATRWDSRALPAGTIVREYFNLPEENLLILIARTPASEVSVMAATLDSGRVVWRDDAMFKSKPQIKRGAGVEYLTSYQFPIVLPDKSLLLYLSRDGPMRIDLATGAKRWQATELANTSVPGLQDGYPQTRLADSLMLVPSEKGLVALDPATGRIRWRTTRDFRDQPSALLVRGNAVLVGGLGRPKPFLSLLSLATGSPTWPEPLAPKESAIAFVGSDTLYLCDDGKFLAVPLATGAPLELAAIDFQGNEQPARIDSMEGGGFLLSSRQNIARIGTDGRVAYRRFYQEPRASLLAKIASSALLVGMNVASYSLTPAGGMAPIIVSNPVLSARFGRASQAKDYFYIFTSSPDSQGRKGFSLVQVDRRDGRELGRIWFADRSPNYRLDAISGDVYESLGDTQVIARRFR